MLNFSLFLVIIGCREIEIFSAARNKASLRVLEASSAPNRLDAEVAVRTPATRDINAGDSKCYTKSYPPAGDTSQMQPAII